MSHELSVIDQTFLFKKLILRHDIDHSIELLEKITNIEHSLGIVSTNFFRIRAKNYNLFSRPSLKVIEKLLNQGHEIGLHYEDLDLKTEKLESLIYFLRNEFGKDTFKVVSPHEPSRCGITRQAQWKNLGILGDAYDERLMNKFKYISDSSCNWREGCMHNFTSSEKSMYILTHPIWWYDQHPGECY
jgi:hypothetical protein